jgi:hypothetical protein
MSYWDYQFEARMVDLIARSQRPEHERSSLPYGLQKPQNLSPDYIRYARMANKSGEFVARRHGGQAGWPFYIVNGSRW